MNRRGEIVMSADEQAAFLASVKTIAFTSIDAKGYPHSVAMWFATIDGLIHMTTFGKSQKVLNVRRNPKVAVLAESGAHYSELRGLLIRGRGEIVEDADLCLAILTDIQTRSYGPIDPAATEMMRRQAQKRVALRVHPERIASWDHSKLGGKY
jgi:general stress protein 26